MHYKIGVISLFIILLSGCGGVSNKAQLTPLDLDGTWMSNCYLNSVNKYIVDVFTFSGNSFTTSYKTWENSSCSGNPISADEGFGTFTVGNTITTPSGLQATEVDFEAIFNGQTIKIMDIIRKKGNTYNYGVFIGKNTRPTDLDFHITLTKQ